MRRAAVILLMALLAGCASQPSTRVPLVSAPAGNGAESSRQIVVTIRDAAPDCAHRRAPLRAPIRRPPRIRARPYARRIISALEHDYAIDWVAGWRIDLLNVHCAVFVAPDQATRDALLARLRQDSRVESAQAMNNFVTSSRAAEYNDPYFSLQKGVEEIHVPGAHRWSQGKGVTVAVIDTGVDTSHPELARPREAHAELRRQRCRAVPAGSARHRGRRRDRGADEQSSRHHRRGARSGIARPQGLLAGAAGVRRRSAIRSRSLKRWRLPSRSARA